MADGTVVGNELLGALERHFFQHFHIDLAALALARVGTYAAFIGADGRIKACVAVRWRGFRTAAGVIRWDGCVHG